MADHGRDRPRRMSRERTAGALGAAVVALALGSAAAATAASQLGPVSPKVLAILNANGKQFVAAHHAHPKVGKEMAAQDALSSAPWRACATGISLMRTTKQSEPSAPGSLTWLVSVHPNKRIGPVSGGPAHHTARHAANYFVVAVSAKSGRFVQAQDGYSRRLPQWTPAKRSPCEGG
jgi:hypothetical protein